MAPIDSVNDDDDDTTNHTVLAHRRALIMPNGPPTGVSSLGLASRIDAHLKADRLNDTPGNLASDVPEPDTAMPEGWESDPNWVSEASVWDEMRGPGDRRPPKTSEKEEEKAGSRQ
jgi:hypothetical protein